MVKCLFFCFLDIKMSVDIHEISEPTPYDDIEEIQLMDTDGTNLQLDEPLISTNTVEKNKEEKPIEEEEEVPPVLVIEVCSDQEDK